MYIVNPILYVSRQGHLSTWVEPAVVSENQVHVNWSEDTTS